MRFHRTFSFDSPCEDVYALLADEAFQSERIAGTGTNPRATVHDGKDGAVVVIELHLSTKGAPSTLQAFVGDSLTITDERHWGPADEDGGRSATIAVRVPGVPVTMDGEVSLEPDGEGCTLEVRGDLRCSIPIVGRAVETQLANGLGGEVDAEADAVARRLDG